MQRLLAVLRERLLHSSDHLENELVRDPCARNARLQTGGDGAAACCGQHERDPVLQRRDGQQLRRPLRGPKRTVVGLAGGVALRLVLRRIFDVHRLEVVEPVVVALAGHLLLVAAPRPVLNAQQDTAGEV